jgi:hypothetical protein
MANEALRTSQLGIVTTLANTDRVVVLTNPATSAQTQTITVTNLALSAANQIPYANSSVAGTVKVGAGLSMSVNGVLSAPLVVLGPYANDAAASSAGIPLKGLYYNNSGSLQIRLT